VNKNFPLLLTSAYYYKSLKDNLVSTIKDRILQSISVLKSNILAHAQGTVDETPASTPTTPEERWAKMFVRPGYNWSLTSKEDRLFLTTQRVEAQNPIDDFRTSEPLKKFEAALSFLAARSAIICLFRTPVTVDYLSIERTIPRSNFDAWDQYIHTLAKSHGIKYVDFHELSYDFSDDKFANADHLTNAHYAEIWPMVAKACFN
jgi:hypothetical protein